MYSTISNIKRYVYPKLKFFPLYLMGTFVGADVNRSTTTNDATVLSLACAGGHFELATILLLNGADPNHLLKVHLRS